MSERISVCEEGDLAHLEKIIIEVGNREVCVFNLDGEYHALLNTCMHQFGPLCEGDIEKKLTAEHGGLQERIDVQYTDDEYIIICPWHSWTYDIKTGKHTGDPNIQVPTFNVIVEDGEVFIEA